MTQATQATPRVIDADTLQQALDRLFNSTRPRLRRLWTYYRNPLKAVALRADGQGSDRPYRQGQEWGLPSRITGVRAGAEVGCGQEIDGVARKEVVIENDIAWRVDTQVDYLFGKPITLHSAAPDPRRREQITQLLRLILAQNGGIPFLQQMALLGSVYGFVDVLVKLDPSGASGATVASDVSATLSGVQDLGAPPVADEAAGSEDAGGDNATPIPGPGPSPVPTSQGPAPEDHEPANSGASHTSQTALLQRLARFVRLEIVEPARALPFCSPDDWRKLEAYAQCYEKPAEGGVASMPAAAPARRGWLSRFLPGAGVLAPPRAQSVTVVELITPDRWQRFEGGRLVDEGANTLGQLPVVHVQNLPTPFQYAGSSEVEPLIPLQDELNTRLSDRANRITLQSFKMYLGKNIDGFTESVVAPGRMWTTDNADAEVIEFGGDSGSSSEEAHIADLREALDKASGVSPIAAGAIKNRIGNLTSAAALRITLFALLSKNDRKRTTYGAGLQRMCELALAWLDHAGLFRTSPEERQVELHWPSPLPENQLETLQEAEVKLRIGVPAGTVLKELGY